MLETWIKLVRDCEVVQIPFGNHLTVPKGTEVSIVQSTRVAHIAATQTGFLLRFPAQDADALGLPLPDPAHLRSRVREPYVEDRVWEALRTCYDPEVPTNIVELGLIYSLAHEANGDGGEKVTIGLMLTAPGCGMGEFLKEEIEEKVGELPGVASVKVNIILDPPWDPSRMTEAARLELGMM
ncbi:MAG: DUF59 domain-containing protein [Deltaproteobacteria bacterium]|nr:DUF59 domain-containing protein [Deltaproteobacteria bacterium]